MIMALLPCRQRHDRSDQTAAIGQGRAIAVSMNRSFKRPLHFKTSQMAYVRRSAFAAIDASGLE